MSEKYLDEQIQKQFTRKIKGDKKMKHRRREPASGASSSNITRDARAYSESAKVPRAAKWAQHWPSQHAKQISITTNFGLPISSSTSRNSTPYNAEQTLCR